VALVGALVEVGLELVELAGERLLPAAVGKLLPGRGAVVALDGVQAPAEVTGDLPQAAALGPQRADQFVLAAYGLGELPRRVWRPGVCWRRVRRPDVVGGRRGGLGQAGAAGGDALLDGLGEVLPQVEPVGDLDRVRRSGSGPVAYDPARSRQITSTPGWAASQSASGWASRPVSMSSGAPVSMSMSSVP
jgi:hypothetical protein